MPALLEDIRTLLVRELNGIQQELSLFPDDDTVWATKEGVANSAGNLALHVAGNIQHFIGDRLGGRPYARDRVAEFQRRSGTRVELIGELQLALAAVDETLAGVTDAQLDAPFEAHPGVSMSTRLFLLHLCTHAAFHLGQLGYLRRMVTGDVRSTGAVSASRIAS